jgi:predicted flap endonuclease-1-like 5' DNA nuclease
MPLPQPPVPDPDDLTAIKGIGPVFATRLNKAGIFTYAQLAAQSSEKLQFITQVTRWDPAEWIAAAKILAQ